jgi:hypothetical protein
VRSDELGHCIRAWRDRLDPAARGLPAGADLRLIVYSAAPGTADAEALALLAVVGLQRMSG